MHDKASIQCILHHGSQDQRPHVIRWPSVLSSRNKTPLIFIELVSSINVISVVTEQGLGRMTENCS